MRPLDRRRLELDEDRAPDMTPDELAAFAQDAREREARRDRKQREQGERLLADYLAPGLTMADACRAYVADLLGLAP